jgi:SH3-like domain-containing protein
MRSRGAQCATRLLLAFSIVMAAGVMATGQRGWVRTAAAADDVAPRMRQLQGRAATEGPARPEARKPGGKPGEAAKHGAKTPDPKSHPTPPVIVAPPVPKPPKEPAANEAANPPPKLPRFAALKTDDTNMRKGPGQRYPIEWVYKRRDLPVEVEREYDVWRYVRDPEGVEGWMHGVTLTDRRTFMVTDKDATLRSDPSDTSSAVAILKVGVIGRLRECDEGSKWCQVQAGGYKGYLRRDQFWGLLPDEVLSPS